MKTSIMKIVRILILASVVGSLWATSVAVEEDNKWVSTIAKRADNPQVWDAIARVLKEEQIDSVIKEIRSRLETSVLTYVVTLDCEAAPELLPIGRKIQVIFDGREWKLDPKTPLRCGATS